MKLQANIQILFDVSDVYDALNSEVKKSIENPPQNYQNSHFLIMSRF